jgi:hypothetical protein
MIVNGRVEATPIEKARIAKLLGFNEAWLFRAIVPPGPAARETDALSPAFETRGVSNTQTAEKGAHRNVLEKTQKA